MRIRRIEFRRRGAADERRKCYHRSIRSTVIHRNSENSTLQVNTGEEFYLHSNGKVTVSLYYATESSQNTGGHTVKFERVSLD
ncbi:hypothetical protein OH492_13255 [Vibrio chagasii]|nr:hypothetical protein [Vibrio chagasii]